MASINGTSLVETNLAGISGTGTIAGVPTAGSNVTAINSFNGVAGMGPLAALSPVSVNSAFLAENPVANPVATNRVVSVCDTQPVTAEGIRTLLAACSDLESGRTTDSLIQARELLVNGAPGVLMVDKAFGIQPILEWLNALGAVGVDLISRTGIVIWGASVTEAEALRFMQAGARGILRKTASIPVVLACLRTVASGRSWMDDCVFGDTSRTERYPRSELTAREQQVLELVEQGYKNREIALELGIRPGTVKIHLKHIFEKTGVRGRYGLALNGLKERGLVGASLPA